MTETLRANDVARGPETWEASQAAQGPRAARGGSGLGRDSLPLVVLLLAGAAAVYLLSRSIGPGKADPKKQMVEAQVETGLRMLSLPAAAQKLARDHAQAIISTLDAEAKQRQVPIDRLRGNPFVFRAPFRPEPPKPVVKKVEPEPVKPAIEPAVTQAVQAAQGLQLQSILVGTHGNTAMISNNLLTEGQTIRGWKIARIASQEVVLTWRDKKHVLRLPG